MARSVLFGILAASVFVSSGWAERKPVTIDAVVNSQPTREPDNPLAWSADGRQFVVSKHGTLATYDVPTGKERYVIALSKLRETAE